MPFTFMHDWTTGNEQIWRVLLRNECPSAILEIGSWEGRSAVFWLQFFPRAMLVCVDDFSGGKTAPAEIVSMSKIAEMNFDHNVSEFLARTRAIKMDSRSALEVLSDEAATFDLIYIDGSHLADDVWADSVLAWPRLRENGIVIWDDYRLRPEANPSLTPKRAIDKFLIERKSELEVLYLGEQVIARKLTSRPV